MPIYRRLPTTITCLVFTMCVITRVVLQFLGDYLRYGMALHWLQGLDVTCALGRPQAREGLSAGAQERSLPRSL